MKKKKIKIGVGDVLLYLLGGLWLLSALGWASEGNIGAIPMGIGGFLMFPPFYKQISDAIGVEMSGWLRFFIALGLLVLFNPLFY